MAIVRRIIAPVAIVRIVRRTMADIGPIFVQIPRRLEQNVALGCGQDGQIAEVALGDGVARRWGAEEQAALATGLDERDDLLAHPALGELEVAADLTGCSGRSRASRPTACAP